MTRIKLSDAIAGRLLWLENENTRSDYGTTYEAFTLHVGDVAITEVTAADVAQFLDHMRRTPIEPAGLAAGSDRPKRYRRPKTLANMHTALASLWRWSVDQGYADRNVVASVPRPRVNHEPVQPLTSQQVVALFRACERSRAWHNRPLSSNARPTAARDKALIAVLLDTLIRASELCAVRWRDVELRRDNGTLYVDLGKGSKSRVVPFQRRCARYVHAYVMERGGLADDDHLFVNSGRNAGLPMTRDAVYKLLRKLGRKCGVHATPHLLRTTGACLMVQNGISAFALQQIMGHSQISTTMRYVRAAQMDLDQATRSASPLDHLRL